jgi:hypothetical protein
MILSFCIDYLAESQYFLKSPKKMYITSYH